MQRAIISTSRFAGPFSAMAWILSVTIVCAAPHPKAGEETEITRRYSTSQESTDGSSGSSNGQDAMLERVVSIGDDGVVLDYDLPKETTPEDRARQWQFPVRVFKPSKGAIRLLNQSDLETRRDAWLKAAKLGREACGKIVFTWTAYRIECDPQSVATTIAAYDIQSSDVREGALYGDPAARTAAPLVKSDATDSGATFTTTLDIDPAVIHRQNAEAKVAVGELMGEPVKFETALVEQMRETLTGTVAVTLDTDAVGNVRRKTRVVRLEVRRPDGSTERSTRTETVERQSLGTQQPTK